MRSGVAEDCIFCKIISKQIPAEFIFEDKYLVAFNDIHPQAPTHFLIVPKKHTETLLKLDESMDLTLGKMFRVAAQLAKEKGVAESGFRTVFNCNKDAGQVIFHIHLHVLGGRPLKGGMG